MPPDPLGASEIHGIESASRAAIEGEMSEIRRRLNRHRWLRPSNRYGSDGIELIRSDAKAGTVDQPSLSQYAAASAVRHIADGWGYLAAALQAALRANSNHSVHLAYYGSLRAALALLASEGILVLNGRNFAVRDPQRVVKFSSRGTHEIAWLALNYWSTLDRSGDLVGDVIRPGGTPLKEWLQAGFGGHQWRQVAQEWVQSWGLDLKLYAADRDLRNAASYRPGGLEASPLAPHLAVRHVLDVWEALEPSPWSPFDRLDRHLGRMALESTYNRLNDARPSGRKYRVAVSATLSRLAMPQSQGDWVSFLTRESQGETLRIIKTAGKQSASPDYRELTSRALLLLRLATGSARTLCESADIGRKSLDFWFRDVLVGRGLVQAALPEVILDLWDDVEVARSGLGAVAGGPNLPSDYADLNTRCRDHAHTVVGVERAAVWGLAG